MTVPRLELIGAIVGLRLTQSVSRVVELPVKAAPFYSPFPKYFKRKGDRETMAPERGHGKYTSNMADDLWLQVHAHRDELRRWLKAGNLKTTGRKQELIDREMKEKQERKRFQKLELLRNCAVHRRIFLFLNFEHLDE